MADPTAFDDQHVIQQVVDLYEAMRHDPIASRLAAIEFGEVDLWSAFRYEFAELLYDHAWGLAQDERDRPAREARQRRGLVRQIKDQLWQGTWGEGLFSRSLEDLGVLDLMERTQFLWRSRTKPRPSSAPIALVGFAHRSGVMRFAGTSFQILLHDDNLGRHRRAVRSLKHDVIPCESFLQTSDYRRMTRHARDVQAILAPGETRGMPLAPVFERFLARSVHRRRFRRLALGAEALRRFMAGSTVKTFVIPDERQPLARTAAMTARLSASARIVCVPESVDQLVRKMPYWGDVLSDLIVLSGAGARRALTRAGVPPATFAVCAAPGVQNLLDAVAPQTRAIGHPTILYCDQALPGAAQRFQQLAGSLGNPPRATLIFRPHPVQSTLLLRLVVTGGKVERSASIVDAIRACDVVVTHSSMVVTIAALLERPVILWNPAASPTMPVLLLEKLAYWARTPDELSTLIARLLESRPDHPLRKDQLIFRHDVEASRSEADLSAVL